MFHRSLSISIIVLSLLCPSAQAQRRSRKPATKPPASALPQRQATGLLDLLPASTADVDLVSEPEHLNATFGRMMAPIGLDSKRCSRVLAVRSSVPGRPQRSTALVVETDQADEFIEKLEQRKTRTGLVGGGRVFQIPINAINTLQISKLGDGQILFGESPAFTAIFSVFKGRQASLFQSRPELRPLFNASRQSRNLVFRMVTPDVLQAARLFIRVLGDPGGEFERTLLSLRAITLDSQDNGKCAIMFRMQFSNVRAGLNTSLVLLFAKFFSRDPGWNPIDVQDVGSLVSVRLQQGAGECSTELIKGRLRVKSPDDDEAVNIDRIADTRRTQVEVIPAESPGSKAVMVMSVKDDGRFSSSEIKSGSERNLVEGNRYILRSTLWYTDNITIDNTDLLGPPTTGYTQIMFLRFPPGQTGCGAPGRLPRAAVRDTKPFVMRKDRSNEVNIDYPLPVVLVHGIRSCYADDWKDWLSYMLNQDKNSEAKLQRGYIVFTPTYKFRNFPRDEAAGQVIDQMESDLNGLFSTSPEISLLCHSNGGIIARVICNAESWNTSIRRVYTMGTPHSGTAEFTPVAMAYGLDNFQMGTFNRKMPTFKGVDVVAIGGNLQPPMANSDRKFDGIVYPQDTVFGIGELELYPPKSSPDANRKQRYRLRDIGGDSFTVNEFPLNHSETAGSPNFLEMKAVIMLEKLIFSDMAPSSSNR